MSRIRHYKPSSVDIISESKSSRNGIASVAASEVVSEDLFTPADFESNETGF
ncbi:unnamed protein product [Brugia timori]|uniref:Uncharacterized protein n=1 Tax=Brugia timori TaxID=42155 RepID=A0A3P7XPZ6_9BILA|nr:unnamed protein product [Brugia timori]